MPNQRFPRGGNQDARRMAATLADLQRRIEALERTGVTYDRLAVVGAIEFYDEAGTLLSTYGQQPDGTTGPVVVDGPVPNTPTAPLVTTRNGLAIVWWGTYSRVNYVADPSFEVGASGFTTTGGATVQQVSTGAAAGVYALGVRWQPGSTLTRSLADMPLQAGEHYTIAVSVTSTTPAVELRVTGAGVSDPAFGSTNTQGSRISVTFRMGETSPTVVLSPVNPAAGDPTTLDNWSVVAGTAAADYFDGDMAGYAWTGEPHASPSIDLDTVAADVSSVLVYADTDPNFLPDDRTYIGALNPRGGPLSFPLPPAILYFVRVVLVSNAGVRSEASAATPVRVRPIEGGDIGIGVVREENIGEGAVQPYHLGFSFSTEAGNTITYGPAPHTAAKADDLWFDTTHGNAPHRYTGTTWEPFAFGSDAIGADAVLARHVAAGEITAAHLAASSVSAEKLSIGAVAAGASRLINYGFEDLDETGARYRSWTLYGDVQPIATRVDTTVEVSIAGDRSGVVVHTTDTAVARLVAMDATDPQPITVRGGETWSVSATVRADRPISTAGTVQIVAQCSDDPTRINDASMIGTTWLVVADAPVTTEPSVIEGKFTLPATARYLTVALRSGPAADGGGGWTVWWDNVIVQPAVSGVQIANGAIRAEEIAARAIDATHIQSGAIIGDLLAGQVVIGSVFATPEMDVNGNPLAFTTLFPALEMKDTARRTKVRLTAQDGEVGYFDGDVAAVRLTTVEGATLEGDIDVTPGSQVTVAGSIRPPGTAPLLSAEYATIRLDTDTVARNSTITLHGNVPVGVNVADSTFDPTQARFMTCNPDGKFVVVTHVSGGSRVWYFNPDGTYYGHTDLGAFRVTGYTADGTSRLAVGFHLVYNRWFIFDLGRGYSAEIDPGGNPDLNPPVITQAGPDTTAPAATFRLLRRFNADWQTRRYRLTGTGLTALEPAVVLATTSVDNNALAGAAFTIADYPDTTYRLFLAAQGVDEPIRVLNTGTGNYRSSEDWPTPVAKRRGFAWNPSTAAFYDLGDNGRLYRYTGNVWSGSVTWWLGGSLYNPATTHETVMGARRGLVPSKRATMRITMPSLPIAPASSDDWPTRWRLYGVETVTGTAAPAVTAYRLQAEGASGATVLVNRLTTTGVLSATATNFATATPARLVTSSGGFVLRGDGTGAAPGMFQCGYVPDTAMTAADTTVTRAVVFPTAFPSTVPVTAITVTATPVATSPASNPRVSIVEGSVTRNGFTLAMARNTTTAFGAYWQAMASVP